MKPQSAGRLDSSGMASAGILLQGCLYTELKLEKSSGSSVSPSQGAGSERVCYTTGASKTFWARRGIWAAQLHPKAGQGPLIGL